MSLEKKSSEDIGDKSGQLENLKDTPYTNLQDRKKAEENYNVMEDCNCEPCIPVCYDVSPKCCCYEK